MRAEHCERGDPEFETTNYGLRTTPRREWDLVVGRAPLSEAEAANGRRVPDVAGLAGLELAVQAGLTAPEIVAVVLYTGPMVRAAAPPSPPTPPPHRFFLQCRLGMTRRRRGYGRGSPRGICPGLTGRAPPPPLPRACASQYHVYNSILRQYPEDLYRLFETNRFPTTIHVLVSAVHKLSRSMQLPTGLVLYRGLGGSVSLPAPFFHSDSYGRRGFTEWGFMSATADRKVAVRYSGVDELKPLPIVLEIRVRAVDRGACVLDFSQYPQEREYIYVPCCFLEEEGPPYLEVTRSGVLTVVPVRVNTNPKTMTVEELVGLKKKLHLSAFQSLVEETRRRLSFVASAMGAEERLVQDHTKGRHTVPAFLDKIVDQCREISQRHEAMQPAEYVIDKNFGRLVSEMVAVPGMAVSKLEEWLENREGSFIQYRFTAALRTVHRRRIAFLEKKIGNLSGEDEVKQAAETLCKVKCLFFDSVDERNELGETPLMTAAAEGRDARDLGLLVAARADVGAQRDDGVCAMWLAAQFGHAHCIQELVLKRGDVNQAARNGATPVYIASQGGFAECVELLASLNADLSRSDSERLTPAHQAAMNGHCNVLQKLFDLEAPLWSLCCNGNTPLDAARHYGKPECVTLLRDLSVDRPAVLFHTLPTPPTRAQSLIISAGDISDVDGLFALAEYSKAGADVLFVMNYPAYIGVAEKDVNAGYASDNPGLGYRYSAAEVLRAAQGASDAYKVIMDAYSDLPAGEQMKGALTDVAFAFVKKVWAECPHGRGQLFFCVGGVNSVNPFSEAIIKNEVLVYANTGLVSPPKNGARLSTEEGRTYDTSTNAETVLDLSKYAKIYLDFNGSMAFFGEKWEQRLSDPKVIAKVCGAFVMGGVRAEEAPVTMSASPGRLNRFSSATMNQLYHPRHTAAFFGFLAAYNVPAYVVTNNSVGTFGVPSVSDHGSVEEFLLLNEIARKEAFLHRLALAHYNSPHKPPRRAFDFYVATALRAHIDGGASALEGAVEVRNLFYSGAYGISLISTSPSWDVARSVYNAHTLNMMHESELSKEDKERRDSFKEELAVMSALNKLPAMTVLEVHFLGDKAARAYRVELRHCLL